MTPAAAARRVRFGHGQRLMAGDLGDAVDAELDAGARHVVGAHATWGIAAGLDVELRDERVVEVWSGVAYDARGRTLLVPGPVRLELERRLAVVVVTWDGSAATVRTRSPDAVRLGLDVPLAAVGKGLDPVVRRYARTRATARIGSGSFEASLTFAAADELRTIDIDARAAGFSDAPSYVVSAAGDLELPGRAGPLVSIADPGPEGFTVRVRYPRLSGAAASTVAVRLDWIGVQPRGTRPNPNAGPLGPIHERRPV